MKPQFDSPTRAIHSFGSGNVDLDQMIAAFDDFLTRGLQIEDLVGAVADARNEGVIDDSQKTQLERAIADTMTVFAGPDSATPPDTHGADRSGDAADRSGDNAARDAGNASAGRDSEHAADNSGARAAPGADLEAGATAVDPAADSQTRIAQPAAGGDTGKVGPGVRLRDRFIIDEVLGVGGMGTVYRGRDSLKLEARDRNPYLAIKVLNDTFAKRPDAFIALQREASRQQRLAHPNIATVFDFDRSGSTMFITMELLEGSTLDKFIRHEVRTRGGLPLGEAMPIIEQLCAALSHAHQRGIVHADFKPGNCFLTQNDEVKVLDFGIARAMKDPTASGRDQTIFDPRSMGALTPAYASPEMLDNSMNADPRDDLYALACVTYELLAGVHPFKRVPADEAREQGMVPERIKSLSRRQNATLLKGLAFEREDRIGSADEFLNGIRPQRDSSLQSPLIRSIAAVLLLGVIGFLAVQYVGSMEERRLQSALASAQPAAVLAAVEEIQQLPPARQLQAVSAHRDALVAFFEDYYRSLVDRPPAEISFPNAAGAINTATALMPDSAALRDLRQEFERLRAGYLSELTDRFETYLSPDYLVPAENREDLHDLLREVAEVDADHPLLTDLRVATAYAESAEEAVQAGDLETAQQIVNSGLMLRVDDPALLDIEDQIEVLRAAARRRAEVARLESEALRGAEALQNPDDLSRTAALLAELTALDSQNAAAAEATRAARAWAAPRADAAAAEEALPAVDAFLSAYREPLRRLGATDLLASVESRHDELVERRAGLVEDLRTELANDSSGAERRDALAALLAALEAIDAEFLAASTLPAEVLQAQSARAERAAVEYQWDDARDALQLARALDLGPAAEQTVAAELVELDQRERVFNEQLAAERAAEAQRRRAAAIAAAEQRVRDQLASLSFDATGANALITATRALAALDPNHSLSAGASQQGAARFVAEARRLAEQADFARAASLIELADKLAPGSTAVADTRAWIDRQQGQWRAQRQRAQVEQAIAAVTGLLSPGDTLATAERQNDIDQRLQALAALDPAPQQLAASRRAVAQAYLDQGERLMADKRFSAAEQLLGLARRNDPALAGLGQADERLAAARDAYRAERAQAERRARIAAGEQQFRSEVAAGQLARAGATAESMQALTAQGSFFHTEAATLLANAYADQTVRYLRDGHVESARQAIGAGRRWATLPRWDALENDLKALEARKAMDSWLAAPASAEPDQVRDWIARHRQFAPENHAQTEQAWIDAAAARLDAAGDEPSTYNPLLARLRAIWPDATAFARQLLPTSTPSAPADAVADTPAANVDAPADPVADTPAESVDAVAERGTAVPDAERAGTADSEAAVAASEAASAPLAQEVLYGRWCGNDVDLEFSSRKLKFLLGRNQSVEYPVRRYVSEAQENITVEWEDPRNGLMLMQFGGFSGDRDTMLQLRGKLARDSNWQVYDRSFSRCG